jgi:hypothetical protein
VLLNQHMKNAKSENRVNQSTLGIIFEKFYTKILNTFGLQVNLDVHRIVWTSFWSNITKNS